MEKVLYTRKEAAEMLSISVDTLDRAKNCGKIKSVNIGSRVYYTPEWIKDFVVRMIREGLDA